MDKLSAGKLTTMEINKLLEYLEDLPKHGKVKFHKDFNKDDYSTAIGQLRVKTKALSLSDVVGQSEQLLALAQYMCQHQNNLDGKTAKGYLQDFLSQ